MNPNGNKTKRNPKGKNIAPNKPKAPKVVSTKGKKTTKVRAKGTKIEKRMAPPANTPAKTGPALEIAPKDTTLVAAAAQNKDNPIIATPPKEIEGLFFHKTFADPKNRKLVVLVAVGTNKGLAELMSKDMRPMTLVKAGKPTYALEDIGYVAYIVSGYVPNKNAASQVPEGLYDALDNFVAIKTGFTSWFTLDAMNILADGSPSAIGMFPPEQATIDFLSMMQHALFGNKGFLRSESPTVEHRSIVLANPAQERSQIYWKGEAIASVPLASGGVHTFMGDLLVQSDGKGLQYLDGNLGKKRLAGDIMPEGMWKHASFEGVIVEMSIGYQIGNLIGSVFTLKGENKAFYLQPVIAKSSPDGTYAFVPDGQPILDENTKDGFVIRVEGEILTRVRRSDNGNKVEVTMQRNNPFTPAKATVPTA